MRRFPFAALAALLTLFTAPVAGAQHMVGTLVDSVPMSSIHVVADSAELVVTHGARTGLEVRMPAGTFALRNDSATLAGWADQAAALPPVSRRTPRDPRPLPGVLLRSTQEGNAMRLARLPASSSDDTVAVFRLEATNGAWVGMTRLSPAAFLALTRALHGVDADGVVPPRDSIYMEFQVDQPAIQIPVAGGWPRYPEALRNAHIRGVVQMQYVVNTSGRADPSSVRLLSTTAPEFARAVYEAMPDMRFRPALVGGRPVRMVVQQAFEFNIR